MAMRQVVADAQAKHRKTQKAAGPPQPNIDSILSAQQNDGHLDLPTADLKNSHYFSSSPQSSPRNSISGDGFSAPASPRQRPFRPSALKLSQNASGTPTPGTPQLRTGIPSSLVLSRSLPSRHNSSFSDAEIAGEVNDSVDPEWGQLRESGTLSPGGTSTLPARPALHQVESEFRSALEYANPEQREHEREVRERRERRDRKRHSRVQGDGDGSGGYFSKWFGDSPLDHPEWKDSTGSTGLAGSSRVSQSQPHSQVPSDAEDESPAPTRGSKQKAGAMSVGATPRMPGSENVPRQLSLNTPPQTTANGKALKRSASLPQVMPEGARGTPGQRWVRLRGIIPSIIAQRGAQHSNTASAVTSHAVNITDELITGGLSTLMLSLWLERDERGHRRVPILLHRLRIRISDSLYPLSGHRAVFRIECEYANGAARWVVYRQLRDFLSLHTHYTVSNAYNRNQDKLPDFPKTSLPYFKFLNKDKSKEKGDEIGKPEFARLQREALENYLLGLIRTVMFHPSSNRVSAFLEVSALSIMLAQSGGAQYKAGFLRIEISGSKGSFGRRGTSWKDKRKQRWCAVRESYFVVVEEPGETTIFDVFMLDSEFKIERPTRYYRQGLNLLHPDTEVFPDGLKPHKSETGLHTQHEGQSRHSFVGTIKSGVSRVFHRDGSRKKRRKRSATVSGAENGSTRRRSYETAGESSSDESSSSDDDGHDEHRRAGMLDPSTNPNPLADDTGAGWNPDPEAAALDGANDPNSKAAQKAAKKARKKNNGDVSKHTFYVENSQTRLKLFARNERQMLQWIAAFEKIAATSHFLGGNRFDSFAPIRLNVGAQWLVDGRDYFWNMARAIMLAKDSIYIHDWWLSPELQLRRPLKERYRLDLLLERKAREGVKIFIILYQEVSSRTTPTDSNYAKQRLMSLHENINVQRSPSHFKTGTFYWAHHEKLCVIDEAIAFMGGLDACFGRWDTPQHALVDDDDGPDGVQIWPGKDYSNPRVSDFHTLNKPFEDMYDRSKVPRMPWHDVSMQVVGQPARDLARHFVQRWNWLLRIKHHTKTMPFLLPPPDFTPAELTKYELTGTCEMQICRSAGPWSLGTPTKIEHSIQNAYLKAIQLSEHFVYIENQFFITSTMVGDVKIENRIGDAIVARAIRAHREGKPWKCCILIPLLPGFTFPVDHSDASAIRIILECQNRTLFRGPHSIYDRLRQAGLEPEDYVNVFSLRNWAKLRNDVLTTEQVYIHAKLCIVDDRLAIIGSANINERSQRGDRDSELAAIIRDTDMIDGSMAGKPFKVGRFAHTLRVRLMREHIGVDVDAIYDDDLMAAEPVKPADEQQSWDPSQEQEVGKKGVTNVAHGRRRGAVENTFAVGTDAIKEATHGAEDVGSKDVRILAHDLGLKQGGIDATAGDEALKDERTMVTPDGHKEEGFASAIAPTLEERVVIEQAKQNHELNGGQDRSELLSPQGQMFGEPANASEGDLKPPKGPGMNTSQAEEDAPAARNILRKHLNAPLGNNPWTVLTPAPTIDPNGFEDPLADDFWKGVWMAAAVHNTEIFRKVFHAIPDDLVTTWKQYREFIAHHDRLSKPPKDRAGPSEPVAKVPSETGDEVVPGHEKLTENVASSEDVSKLDRSSTIHQKNGLNPPEENGVPESNTRGEGDNKGRRPAKPDEPFEPWEREEMEKLLNQVCGHLVVFPSRFLEGEDLANNFLFNADRVLPLPIYD